MLKGISPVVSPDLLKTLAEMGHGDEIVISDAHFPGHTFNARTLRATIPHEQSGKYSGAKVFLKPAAPGTGVIAGGAMRAVLESVGVKDVLAKSKGSSNPHSVVKATINALLQMKDPYMVAQLRGVSLDKVFNG